MMNITHIRPLYRVWQVVYRLTARVQPTELQLIYRLLPTTGQRLFLAMDRGDQRHSIDVCQTLIDQGENDLELLAAALLHDAGKGSGRVPFIMRPTLVIFKRFAPNLLVKIAGASATSPVVAWRRPFQNAWHHAEVGATLAQEAGLSPHIVELIRTHHDPHGPAAVLHAVDERQ